MSRLRNEGGAGRKQQGAATPHLAAKDAAPRFYSAEQRRGLMLADGEESAAAPGPARPWRV